MVVRWAIGGRPRRRSGAEQALRQLVERIVSDAGYDLDDLTVTPAGRRRVVRVIIDADGGVSLDDAARAEPGDLRASSTCRRGRRSAPCGRAGVHARGHQPRDRPPAHPAAALPPRPDQAGRRDHHRRPVPSPGTCSAASDDAVQLVTGPDGSRGARRAVRRHRPGGRARSSSARRPPRYGDRLGIDRTAEPDDDPTPTDDTTTTDDTATTDTDRRHATRRTPTRRAEEAAAMNVDIAALRAVEKEKGIEFGSLIETLETALLTAYRHTQGHAGHARVEIDRKTGEIRVLGPGSVTASRGRRRAGVGRHPGGLRPDRRHHRPAGHPAAAAGRRQRAHLRRLRRPRARPDHRHGLGRRQGQRARGRRGQPRRRRGHHPGRRAGAGRDLHPRPAAPLLRRRGRPGARADRRSPCPGPIPNLVRKLFALEVPEIADGTVEITAVAREAGHRSKIAVRATVPASTPRAPASVRWARGCGP